MFSCARGTKCDGLAGLWVSWVGTCIAYLYAFCKEPILGNSFCAFAAATHASVMTWGVPLSLVTKWHLYEIMNGTQHLLDPFWEGELLRFSLSLQNSIRPQGVSLLRPMRRILPHLCAATSASSCSSSGTEAYAFSGWYCTSPNIGTYLRRPQHVRQDFSGFWLTTL